MSFLAKSPSASKINSKKGVLQLLVIGGRDLVSRENNGITDAFCYVSYENQKFKTKVDLKTSNPKWNETFTFELEDVDDLKGEILIECWEKEKINDEFLGKLTFPLNALSMCPIMEGWYCLEKRTHNNKIMKGEIEIRVDVKKLMDYKKEKKNKEFLVGYISKLGEGLLANWKRRWFVLDKEKLAYFTPELDKKPEAIYNIMLTDIQHIVVDKGNFNFSLVTTCKGNRTFQLSVDNKKSQARWALGIDGLKHLNSYKFESSIDVKVKRDLLASLYLTGFNGGHVRLLNASKSYSQIEWYYSPEGSLKCLSMSPTKFISLTEDMDLSEKSMRFLQNKETKITNDLFQWDGNKLISITNPSIYGYGIHDGVRLAWVLENDDVITNPFNYYCEDRSFINLCDDNLSCYWNGLHMKSNNLENSWNWVIDGDVPEPIAMMIHILSIFCEYRYY